MKRKTLFYNGHIYTQADLRPADSMVINGNMIVAVGKNLRHDPEFIGYDKVDLKGKAVIPGLVDAHAHFLYFAKTLHRVALDDCKTIPAVLAAIHKFTKANPKSEWIYGDGFSPDKMPGRIEPDRYQLDSVTGGRPAFIYYKDHHSAWVNSKALEIAGITRKTVNPARGEIVRQSDNAPTGILREWGGYGPVFEKVPGASGKDLDRAYDKALQIAYSRGVTGVHSFDKPDAFSFYSQRAERGTVGLRINFYPTHPMLPDLLKTKTGFGAGDSFFRFAGIKIFADGALGSQTALMFKPYEQSKNNHGIEVTSTDEIVRIGKQAAKLGFPLAVHAIGDKAVSNTLDAFEQLPSLKSGARHRIEHLQCIRRSDIKRIKRLKAVASMQPSHCPSDITMARKHWGARAANAYIFRDLIDSGIDLAFGSDAPIEPLHPIHGIAAAVRRALPKSKDVFYPKQRIPAAEALFGFTVGAAIASGEEDRRGYLLPGYTADFVVLSDELTKAKPSSLYDIHPLATVLDGKVVFCHSRFSL